MQRFLDFIEKVGNKVPHPVVIFLILIAIVIVLSGVLGAIGTSVTVEAINADTNKVEQSTIVLRSLVSAEGIRFIYSSLIPNYMVFTADFDRNCRPICRGIRTENIIGGVDGINRANL